MNPTTRPPLEGLPLFADAPPAELGALRSRLREQRCASGQLLMREGEAGASFAVLTEGRVEISRATPGGAEVLAEAQAGAVLGELALLRGEPRGATVTAVEPCAALWGGAAELSALLEVTGVHERVRRTVSGRLAADALPVEVPTRGGVTLFRPLLPSDRGRIVTAIDTMSATTRRRRFFTSAYPSEKLIDYLLDIDYVDHFAWIVLDPSAPAGGVAVARSIRDPDHPAVAEAAFTVLDPYQGRGIGTLLVGALGAAAVLAGIERFRASMLADNTAMRRVFEKVDARFSFVEPGVLGASLSTAASAALLDPAVRGRLETAARDVVTAAGLALAHPST